MRAKDIQVDDNWNPVLRNGDFFIDDSDEQHIEDIMMSNPGDWKSSPLLGWGIGKRLREPNGKGQIDARVQSLTAMLAPDGLTVKSINLDDMADFIVEAERG